MNELIKKCQELYQALERKMLEVANQDIASKQTVEDLKKEAARLQELGKDLLDRGNKLKHIEDVAAALEETRKLKADISKQYEELKTDRTAFIALRDRTAREQAEEKQALEARSKTLGDLAAKLDQDRAKLVEDRKTMKAQLLADMAKA